MDVSMPTCMVATSQRYGVARFRLGNQAKIESK